MHPPANAPRERPFILLHAEFGNTFVARYAVRVFMSTSSGVYYQCQRCTNCCRWPGFVKVDDTDIAAISAQLGLSEHDFIQLYTRLRPRGEGLALIDKANGECIFLHGRDCAVQSVKPRQCLGFPNTWNFPGWREVCEAIPVPVDGQEIASTILPN